ncbi:MAG: MOSC domain-containing protein [Bdellovibrionota bacterium]
MSTHRILSLNIGDPEPMEWKGKTIVSSMRKHSVPGPLVVHVDSIVGNTFAQPEFHGAPHSVLYAFGLKSALEFTTALGLDSYEPGTTGETITLDELDEFEVSVGDRFRFGSVLAEVSYPRIPCGKVNFRMQHERGQKAMQECGRSGIYFRILEPGKIAITDKVQRVDRAKHTLLVSDVYRIIVKAEKPTPEIVELAKKNAALPKRILEKWSAV